MTRSEFVERWRGDFELTVSIERDLEELLVDEAATARARVGVLTGALEYAVRYFGSGSFAMAGVGEAVEVMRAALGAPTTLPLCGCTWVGCGHPRGERP